ALGDNENAQTISSALYGASRLRDPRNRHLNKGLLIFDRTHIVKANGAFDLPFGPNRLFLSNAPSYVQRVVEGWQLSSVFSWVSGAPLTFVPGTTTTPFMLETMGFRAASTADLVGNLPKGTGSVQKGNGFVQYFSDLSVKQASLPNFGGDPNLPSRFTN